MRLNSWLIGVYLILMCGRYFILLDFPFILCKSVYSYIKVVRLTHRTFYGIAYLLTRLIAQCSLIAEPARKSKIIWHLIRNRWKDNRMKALADCFLRNAFSFSLYFSFSFSWICIETVRNNMINRSIVEVSPPRNFRIDLLKKTAWREMLRLIKTKVRAHQFRSKMIFRYIK